MLLTAEIETEAAYLAFHFALEGLVPVIFWAGGSKLYDVVPLFQLVGELSKIVAEGKFGEPGTPQVHNAVGVEVKGLLRFEFVQPLLVETEARPTSSETGHKDVGVDLHRTALVPVIVDHFQHFFVDDADGMNVSAIVFQELVEFGGRGESFDLVLVSLLSEFTPEGI